MKTAIKRKNGEFLVIYLEHVTSLTGFANPVGTPKLWAITHENGYKHENNEFLVINLKHVLGLKVVENRPRTPKLWAIAHKNGHKTQKRRVSSHFTQTCIES